MLLLTTAIAMSCVNVVEQKKRNEQERVLVWASNFSHETLATQVLPGLFDFMMHNELCPTTNEDIISVRAQSDHAE